MKEIVRHEWTDYTRENFLNALKVGYTVGGAASMCGFSRSYMYQLRNADEGFAKLWDEALEEGKDYLEDEARRRAVEGVRKPVFYQGVQCGDMQEYSDTLLLAMLKARRSEVYRDKVDQNITGNIKVEPVSYAPEADA